MACTITVQNISDYYRNVATLTAVLGNPVAGYGGNNPAINIANEVLSEILAEDLPWKWNRIKPAPFVVNQLQFDYCTSITNLGWLENATRLDTSDTSIPPVIRGVEQVRELLQTSWQGIPNQISWVYNSEAICGTWSPDTTFTNPNGLSACPVQPFIQIRDTNGNIQVVTTFGTTGATPPTWATAPGQTTTDGTVVWTCIDPNGIAFRLSPLPAQNGNAWLIQPFYQAKPRLITSISSTWAPIPDELSYVYKQGFYAKALKLAEDDRWQKEYLLFEAAIKKAIGAGTRETESFGMYPSTGMTGGATPLSPDDYTGAPPGTFSGWGW
jgi:hypothetical protein